MSIMTIYIKQFNSSNKQELKNNAQDKLYAFLVCNVLNMKINKKYLYIKPNYKLINSKLEVIFDYKNQKYKLMVDGKNKLIIANNIKLLNINKLALNYLKVQKQA